MRVKHNETFDRQDHGHKNVKKESMDPPQGDAHS